MINIVCLEDSQADFFFFKRVLKSVPECRCQHYTHLNDFLEKAEPYDLIVVDLSLPDGYGPEIIQKIRKITGKPIIVLSGVGGENTPHKIKQMLKNAGATFFLSKSEEGYGELPNLIKQLT